jgi:hypothetical protein
MSLAVADLNADGNPDIALASFDDHKVYVLMGNGNGTFQDAVSYLVGLGPHGIVVGDLNGDGKPDIAVANSSDYSVSVLLNDGLGGFGPAAYFPAIALPLSLAIADLNGDLKPDIVTANFDSNNAAVLINTTPFPPGPNSPPVALCKNVALQAGSVCTANASINDGSYDPDGDPITSMMCTQCYEALPSPRHI